MTETWRLFVAVPIGDVLRSELATALSAWRDRPDLAGLRWSDPAGWHLTLAFLGATDPASVERLARSIAVAGEGHEPMQLPTGDLGAFPSRRRARVAWYGVADPEGRLAQLAAAVREAVGVEAGTPFRAHLTLGRAKGEPVDLRGWIQDAAAPTGRLAVEEVHLMRSHVGRGPARYESLAAVPLGAPARV